MNVIQEIRRINERELEQGVSGKASWHHEYKDSAWVFAGGFPYDLTEGDILCVMSQWGEIEDINLCREKDTGKSKVLAGISGRNGHWQEGASSTNGSDYTQHLQARSALRRRRHALVRLVLVACKRLDLFARVYLTALFPASVIFWF